MAHYPFSERADLLVLTCTHVLEGGDVTVVCHHFNDNTWEFTCGSPHTEEDAIVLRSARRRRRDPSEPCSCMAVRQNRRRRILPRSRIKNAVMQKKHRAIRHNSTDCAVFLIFGFLCDRIRIAFYI